MQRQIYCILLLMLIKKVSFSQSVEDNRCFQFDKIVSQTMRDNEFLITIGSSYNPRGEFVYNLKRTKESCSVTSYATDVNNDIGDVFSLFVNDDTLLIKTVDTLYNDIKLNHNHKPYSKETFKGGYFFLTFYENGKPLIFSDNGASQNQLNRIKFVVTRLNALSVSPFGGQNRRKKYLGIITWNELLQYLKSDSVDGPLK